MNLPTEFFDYTPILDQPGWFSWNMKDESRFNTQAMGPMMVRRERDRCRLRMIPERRHTNLQNMIHGAVTLALIDISLFSAMHVLRANEAGMAVTLELSTQFIGGGKVDEPLDALVEVMRETKRLLFMRGEVLQGDHLVSAFSGLVRKSNAVR